MIVASTGQPAPPNGAEIKAIILDYAGVMTAPIPSMMTDALSASEDPTDLRTQIRAMMSVELHNPDPDGTWNRLERGEISLDAFAELVESRFGGAAKLFRASGGQLMATLAIRIEMVDRIRQWRDAGLKIGLLTNNVAEWRSTWRAKLVEADALHLFDVIIDSSEVGMRKPEARIYVHAANELDVERHEAMFVDDFAHNVEGARSAGLHAVHATSNDSHFAVLDSIFGPFDLASASPKSVDAGMKN